MTRLDQQGGSHGVSERMFFIAAFVVILIVPSVGAYQTLKTDQSNDAQLANTLALMAESQAQQRRLLEELSKKIAEPKKNPWTEATTLVPLIIALGGWVFAYRQNKRLQEDTRNARMEQHLFDSLEFFSGRTQRRSIGIAVVKANWDKFQHFQPTWLSLLVSQAIYLLLESKSYYKSHELANLKNIMDRLLGNLDKVEKSDCEDLQNAIKANRDNVGDKKKNGLKNIEPKTLEEWESKLTHRMK